MDLKGLGFKRLEWIKLPQVVCTAMNMAIIFGIFYEARNGQRLKNLRLRYLLGKREFLYAVTFLEPKVSRNAQEVILHL
jgi:hypothetical protein